MVPAKDTGNKASSMSLLKNLKTIFSSKKKPDIYTATSYHEFCEKVDYYILTNRKIHFPDAEESSLHVFWMILYGLQRASRVTMDDSTLVGYSPLLEKHVRPEELFVYFAFADETVNNFQYGISTIKRSLEAFGDNPENGLNLEYIREISLRTEIAENVKTMFLQICDEFVKDKRWMIETVMNSLSFGVIFFDLLSNYLIDEENPNYEYIDDVLCRKFVGAYGKNNIRVFENMIMSKDRDAVCFVTSVLILKGKCKFLETYMLATRSINFLNAILQWVSGDSHMDRLIALMINSVSTSSTPSESSASSSTPYEDVVIPILRRVSSIVMAKNLASSAQIFHLLNDVVYFMGKVPAATRAKMFAAMVITIHRNNERIKDPSKRINLEESFNMLFNVTDDEFLVGVRDYLSTEESLYVLYDGYLHKLLKEPFELRMKYIKGHILLLMRNETVRLIEEDPDINMDRDDIDSVPAQISRTMMLVPNQTAKKLHMVIESGESMKKLFLDPINTPLALKNTEEDDVFQTLERNKLIAGNGDEVSTVKTVEDGEQDDDEGDDEGDGERDDEGEGGRMETMETTETIGKQ